MHRVTRLLLLAPFIAGGIYLAQEKEIWVVPESETKKPNPIEPNAASIDRGRHLYQRQCLSCHGESGAGDGPLAERLGLAPGNLSDPAAMGRQTDGEIFWKIATGRAAMPGFKTSMGSTDNQIWDLVNFTRSLAPSPENERDDREPPSENK